MMTIETMKTIDKHLEKLDQALEDYFDMDLIAEIVYDTADDTGYDPERIMDGVYECFSDFNDEETGYNVGELFDAISDLIIICYELDL